MARNLGTRCFVHFNEWAKAHGFTRKVVGAYAYRNKAGHEVRLISAQTATAQVIVYQTGKGRFSIGWPKEEQ